MGGWIQATGQITIAESLNRKRSVAQQFEEFLILFGPGAQGAVNHV
jgi:hypothetical protein